MSTTAEAAAPARTPPPGQHTNYVNPPTIAPDIVAALTVCLALTTISALLRCWAQISLFKKLNWADAWMLFGWAFQAAFTGFLAACLPYGAGRHIYDVSKAAYAHINFLLFINFILYGCAILGPKMSILLQLVAIFVPRGRSLAASARWFYWAAVSLMAVNFIYYLAHNIALIFQCQPIAKGWDPVIPGSCINQAALLLSSGPFNIISDFLIFLLPLTVVWQLKLPTKTRLELAFAFTVGLFGTLCSAVRLYYSNQLGKVGDSTVLTFQNQLWANAEVTSAIIIANIIILPRFIRSKREVSASSGYAVSSSEGSYHTSNSKPREPRSGTGFTRTKRNPLSDPFLDLEVSPERKGGHEFDDESKTDIGADTGTMRTVEIDTVKEYIRPPPQAALRSQGLEVARPPPMAAEFYIQSPQLVKEAPKNRTGWYEGESD